MRVGVSLYNLQVFEIGVHGQQGPKGLPSPTSCISFLVIFGQVVSNQAIARGWCIANAVTKYHCAVQTYWKILWEDAQRVLSRGFGTEGFEGFQDFHLHSNLQDLSVLGGVKPLSDLGLQQR